MSQTDSNNPMTVHTLPPPRLNTQLNAIELMLFQQLAAAELPPLSTLLPDQLNNLLTQKSVNSVWIKVERVLREYSQYHFGRTIRSAALVDALSIPDF